MRTIKRTRTFKRDYRREKRGQYRETLDAELQQALILLTNDEPMPPHYRDHPMHESRGLYNCHLRPNLVLLYRKPNPQELELVRLGSHSELKI